MTGRLMQTLLALALAISVACAPSGVRVTPLPGPPFHTVQGTMLVLEHPDFLGGRRCWIYLPPGYGDTPERYPVLYFMDGQYLFDQRTSPDEPEWGFDETCEAMISRRDIPPLIVVGIGSDRATRSAEYAPPFHPEGTGEAFLSAVIHVLKPEIDRRFRTRAGSDDTWIGGASLGGLIATWAGWAHHDVFGRAASMAGSFWYAGGAMLDTARAMERPALSRLYLDTGQFDNLVEGMAEVAREKGFVDGVDLMSWTAPGHRHSSVYFGARVPVMLRFLTGAIDTLPGGAAASHAAAHSEVRELSAASAAGPPTRSPAGRARSTGR